jgi:hypothetical protein
MVNPEELTQIRTRGTTQSPDVVSGCAPISSLFANHNNQPKMSELKRFIINGMAALH